MGESDGELLGEGAAGTNFGSSKDVSVVVGASLRGRPFSLLRDEGRPFVGAPLPDSLRDERPRRDAPTKTPLHPTTGEARCE